MKAPLILFLCAAVLPVFFNRLRTAPMWLLVQAVALAWNGAALHGLGNWHGWAALLEVLLLRGLIAPLLLRRALLRRGEPDVDLMPSNLFTWAIAITLIALAFEFGAPAMNTPHGLTLGVVAATVMVALLLLATNSAPPAQLVALLTMENALALFEALLPEPWPLPVHLAISTVFLLVVGVGAWLVGAPERPHAYGSKARATA